MKILSYLAFTLLSIVIQFCVMDFIQAKMNMHNDSIDLNVTSQKSKTRDIAKNSTYKQYALYYNTNNRKMGLIKTISPLYSTPTYINSSITEASFDSENVHTSTVYDILMYDENTTLTENSFTTDLPLTSTEYENVTDLTIFNKKNDTGVKTNETKRKLITEQCECNLLYELCDIGCCCDEDCSEIQRQMFPCAEYESKQLQDNFFCPINSNTKPILSNIDNLFCIAQTNLPDKQDINNKMFAVDEINEITERSFKWQDTNKSKTTILFTRKLYEFGDPIWLLRNGSVSYIDLPYASINDNCNDRKPIAFLKEQEYKCNVIMVKDLETPKILEKIDETIVVSVNTKYLNNSELNCTTLHCTNWTILFCNSSNCSYYNNTLHEPYCTDFICINIATRVEYVFYFHNSKITTASIYLYTENISPKMQFITQHISVKFYLTINNTTDILKLSGNPGYLVGAPVIVSYAENNYTHSFFDRLNYMEHYITFPDTKNGICLPSKNTKKTIKFGSNVRRKCRYEHKGNRTCESIQNNMIKLLKLNSNAVVSPLGNPRNLKDNDWIKYEVPTEFKAIEEFHNDDTLSCNGMIAKVSVTFAYADVSVKDNKKNKILRAKVFVATRNLTFSAEDVSLVLTVETQFVDITRPPVYQFAGSPQLNIHLPQDFFFPFPSNSSYRYKCVFEFLLICSIAVAIVPK